MRIKRELTDKDKAQWCVWYQDGYTTEDIARHWRVSRDLVREHLRNNGGTRTPLDTSGGPSTQRRALIALGEAPIVRGWYDPVPQNGITYTYLLHLVRKGLVLKEPAQKRRNRFTLSQQGKEALHALLAAEHADEQTEGTHEC